MYNFTKRMALVISFLLPLVLLAQTGTIRGTVIEDASGETLIGVTVVLQGTDSGTSTDFDGAFELNVAPGTYSLEISYISYQPITITDIVVADGEVNLLENIRMLSDSEQLEEVVITAEVIRSSETALMTIKRKSSSLVDGISSAKFKKIGDSNAASAVKRVTGVSVEGGKYVYVRGLGDRYTKTMLNGMDIPGLDPDRNSLQIDIFPTNLISNMMVYKSATADLPADFTGGVVNIETKDFPDERIFDVSLSMGFTPGQHLNSDFLTYDGGATDWLGFDDGTRELPTAARRLTIPSPLSGDPAAVTGAFVRDFSPTLGTKTTTSLPDFSLGFSYGDQKTFDNDNKLGYIVSGTYKSSRAFYDDYNLGEYQLSSNSEVNELTASTTREGQLSEENVLLGGLVGLAFKTKQSKYKLSVMHLQNGEKKTGQFDIFNNSDAAGQSGYEGFVDNLDYSQRRLTNIFLKGEYFNEDKTWEGSWSVSPTLSGLSDPDVRSAGFSIRSGNDFIINPGEVGVPNRIWRSLDETNIVSRVDLTRRYNLFDQEAKLKFGAGYVFKERDYSILSYSLAFFGNQPDYNGNTEIILDDQFLYPLGPVYYSSGNNVPNPNEYNSTVNNTSVYISNEFNPTPNLKAMIGLRAENYVQHHTGRDATFASSGTDGNNLVDAEVLNSLDLFPSINLTQTLGESQNLRFSYAKTIARPSFKELSFAQILDPVSNRIFNGGLFVYDDIQNNWSGNLTETRIQNLDLRWEAFSEGGQLLSVSAFYKHFSNPIELVRIPTAQTSNEFQPRNVGDGQVYGLEFEVRRKLGFIAPRLLDKVSFNTNITIVRSAIEMTDTEFNSRQSFAKEGQEVSRTRDMAGQAPYIINAGLVYSDIEKAFNMGVYYNVKGSTLTVVGGGLFPDVYSEPFHGLKFTMNKSVGPDDRLSIGLEVDNILNDVREENFVGFNAADQVYTQFSPGTSIGLNLKYSIF